jgi:hypothetical protein
VKESLESRFYALVRTPKKEDKKKRRCLKCGKMFITTPGIRRCGECDIAVAGWSERAESIVNGGLG